MAFKVTRRKFLQTASIAAASVPLSKVATAKAGVSKSPFTSPGAFADSERKVGGICEMCFWRCQMVGRVRDNKLLKLEGNPKSIDNGAAICARGNAGVKLLYDPDRLKYPMRNVGERGNPKWKRISWKEALDECGNKLNATVKKYTSKGIAMFPHGASAKYPMVYFEHTVGTPNVSEASFFQCRGVRDYAWLNTIGMGPDENVDMANAKVIFGLGCHFGENIHVSHTKRYLKGLERGAKLIIVDPRFSASAAKADIWVKIKPGTDTAFLLGMMNYIIDTKKYDADFIDEYGAGFDEFKDAIKEGGWTVKKAAKECEIPAAQIKQVADLLAANAPNVSIHPGRFSSWHGNDFQRGRALGCLAGLFGALGVPGGFVKGKGPGGFGKVKWGHGHEHHEALHREADIYKQSPAGTPTDLIRDCAITGKPYPIKSCVIWGQNPIQTIPNQQKTIDMLKQMDFVMCVDVMPVDITMYADILLPESSYLERFDYIKKGTQWDLGAKQQQYVSARMPMVKADFERKDQVYICNELAKRMGHEEAIPVHTIEEMVDKILEPAGLSINKLIEEDGVHIQPGVDPYGQDDFEVTFYNEDLEDQGYHPAPTYIPVAEVPKGYLRLLSGRSPLHSFNRTQNNLWLHNAMPENPVWVNDKTADKLGLVDGDRISMTNSEGVESGTTSHVKVTPGIREDCVFMSHGYGTASPAMTVAKDAGIDDQKMCTILAVDPETGCHGMRNNFVKLVKA